MSSVAAMDPPLTRLPTVTRLREILPSTGAVTRVNSRSSSADLRDARAAASSAAAWLCDSRRVSNSSSDMVRLRRSSSARWKLRSAWSSVACARATSARARSATAS
ncbi:MAG: hypothetical protein P8008_05615 [Gammaproteobacteria bacterium]